MDKMKVYNKLPTPIQNIACSAEGYRIQKYRYPKYFDELLYKFMQHDNLTLEQIRKVQVRKLQKLLVHCQNNVPYYTDLFRKIGFRAEEFDSLSAMEQLPILTKADINRDYDKFIAKNVNKKDLLVGYTGGDDRCKFKAI